jgi:hypothetical protein
MSKISNVVLVHGAWADASSWSKVIPLLVAKGLKVTAVQLPLNSYEADVATVRRAIELGDGSNRSGGTQLWRLGCDSGWES